MAVKGKSTGGSKSGSARSTKPRPDEIATVSDEASWQRALQARRPILVHLNADTTWLLQLPLPEGVRVTQNDSGRSPRTRFNILIDPWLQGPQSDVASWFSTQWHIVEPSVSTMAGLNSILMRLEGGSSSEDESESYVDAVVVSHEFTDHCHRATLQELSPNTPIFATEEAAKLIQSWKWFDNVITTPPFSSSSTSWQDALADPTGSLPPWLGIGRVVTAGNALYYHSAVLVAFDLTYTGGPATRTRSRRKSGVSGESAGGEAVIYSPHGIQAQDLQCVGDSGLKTLALLHGLHDVKIWMTAQLNLGALNGIKAARACDARYWIATHDEAKRGWGLISWFLQRTVYTLRDAIESEQAKEAAEAGEDAHYEFNELGSGRIMVLA